MDRRGILDLIERSAAIPSMPQPAARFLEMVQDPDFDLNKVVEVLSVDPGMVSEILRLANSPLFGAVRRITSLSQALALLGVKRVRSLVLGRYIVDSIGQRRPPVVDIGYYWQRALATAVLTARLATPLQPQFREEAFTAGLLADCGIVILDETLGDRYRPIAVQYRPHGTDRLADLERESLQITHGYVSARVLERWQLPETVCEAARWHADEPADAGESPPALLSIVGAADRIGKYLCETPQDLDDVVAACQSVMAGLGLEPPLFAGMLQEVESHIQEVAAVLRIRTTPSWVSAAVAGRLRDPVASAACPAPTA